MAVNVFHKKENKKKLCFLKSACPRIDKMNH